MYGTQANQGQKISFFFMYSFVDAQKSPGARCHLVVGWMWVALVLMGC
jgi:hypothetical protein